MSAAQDDLRGRVSAAAENDEARWRDTVAGISLLNISLEGLIMRTIKTRSGKSIVENLEARTLLSSWGVIDDYQLAAGQIASAHSMATDSAGNVYAIGNARDSSNRNHGIVREKLAGSVTWSTIEDFPGAGTGITSFYAVAVDSGGDVYVGGKTYDSSNNGQWVVLEKLASSSGFAVVDNFATGGIGVEGLAIDGAGNVFAAGQSAITGKGNNVTDYWTVRKRTGGVGAFTTVDNAISGTTTSPNPYSATYIAGGAAAGLYVVGMGSGSQWLVRKSTDAGATWTTVDSFLYNSTNAHALSVTGDGKGDVYVVGSGGTLPSTVHWLVRESVNGGTSWCTVDDFGLGGTQSIAGSVGADLAGNVYVAGSSQDPSGAYHGIIRTNAGGSWATVSDVTTGTADLNGFTVDPSGMIYFARGIKDSTNVHHWTIMATQGPTASALAFSAQPASVTAGAAASPAFAVKVKTTGGATVVGDSSTVTLSILSGPAGGKLSGTFIAKANHGVATFPNLRLIKAGTYRLKATDGKLTSANSSSFKLVAAKPTKLAFLQQPPAGTVGKSLSPAVTVAVQDNYGNVVATDHSTVKLSISSGPLGAILSGVVSVTDISGIATFSNLRLSEAGTYKLKATDGADAAAISIAFKIS